MCASVSALTDRTGHRHADAHARPGTLPQPLQMQRGQGNVRIRRRSPCLSSDAAIRGAERRASRRACARGILKSWGKSESIGGTFRCCNIVVQRALARARPRLHHDFALHRFAQGPCVHPLQLQRVTPWSACQVKCPGVCQIEGEYRTGGVRAPRANARYAKAQARCTRGFTQQALTLACLKKAGTVRKQRRPVVHTSGYDHLISLYDLLRTQWKLFGNVLIQVLFTAEFQFTTANESSLLPHTRDPAQL